MESRYLDMSWGGQEQAEIMGPGGAILLVDFGKEIEMGRGVLGK